MNLQFSRQLYKEANHLINIEKISQATSSHLAYQKTVSIFANVWCFLHT
ncbi:hypothetical protein VCHE25_1435 [Vibrio cholerae HE-25]|nr:hypothetical protein VCHE25_1435 [Vibrio cholerae HE-25]